MKNHRAVYLLFPAITTICFGLAILIVGIRLETRPRTNFEDDVASCVLAFGAFLIGVGVAVPWTRDSLPFERAIGVTGFAIVFTAFSYFICVLLFWAAWAAGVF